MTVLRWVLIAVAGLAAAAFAGSFLFRLQISEFLFKRAVQANFTVDRAGDLGDGLHVFVCGAGTPLPDPKRNGPCMAVIAGPHHFVIDAGSGGARTMIRMGYPIGEIDAILLTHLHSDHMDGLGEQLMQAWVNGGRDTPLPVYGPPGVEELVAGFNAAYRIDGTYRTAHHGADIANPNGRGGAPVPIIMPKGPGGQTVIFDQDGVKVTAFRVNHQPVETAYGYRVDYKNRSVAFSGDTIYDANLVAASTGTEILFHEALNREMVLRMHDAAEAAGRPGLAQILSDILTYHATPEDAARSATEAGVRRLVFYHTIPPLPTRALNALFLKDAKGKYAGPMDVAEDGVIYALPADSREIKTTRAF
ncbi:MBL fold metallo-hydrolase [Hyphomonas sp.]|uniref:MBL fold metallo-hydrolase n=1 Tax=Hyphomonas sp. TaxID=87 RepID=UPI00391BDA85